MGLSNSFISLYKFCLGLRGEYFNGLSDEDILYFVTKLSIQFSDKELDDLDEGYLIRELGVVADNMPDSFFKTGGS